jgi:hypothetical protein
MVTQHPIDQGTQHFANSATSEVIFLKKCVALFGSFRTHRIAPVNCISGVADTQQSTEMHFP